MSLHVGPIIFDLHGTCLSEEERELLKHPLISGVILFSRNYENPAQVMQLCFSIREINPDLVIMVDQEGGRVQRFREGLTKLPPLGHLGNLYQHHKQRALELAEKSGWLMATEILALGVDLSLAPVLDLDKGLAEVIGDRAFSHDPSIVTELAKKYITGMKKAGMSAIGKHFPGHGSVNLDSHLALPIDSRNFSEIEKSDLQPFVDLIQFGITSMMPAHILFPEMDDKPVGFSSCWLQTILRERLQFKGIIVSDDLSMKGSECIGDYLDRAHAAITAGCELLLVCNNRDGVITILDNLKIKPFLSIDKFKLLTGKRSQNWEQLQQCANWKAMKVEISRLNEESEDVNLSTR